MIQLACDKLLRSICVTLWRFAFFRLFDFENSSADMNKTALFSDCFNPPGTHFVSNQRFQFLCLLKFTMFFKLGSSDEING